MKIRLKILKILEIADAFGVFRTTISSIHQKRTWTHVL
jgi:hypothetical protein